MTKDFAKLRNIVESILGCNLAESIGVADKGEADDFIQRFLQAISGLPDEELSRQINPQWVVLAAGKGTRIDPSSRLNKTLDVWFGEKNTLHLSRSYLPGSRPHIIVINPEMARRVAFPSGAEGKDIGQIDGAIPAEALDPEMVNRLFGSDALLCIQPKPNGTGGAFAAALSVIADSDAEFIGVAFSDEPFLNRAIYLQTLMGHFIAGADITLCGKRPETVVDKGGLFFDSDGKFIGTKEWYDMTAAEKDEMRRRLERGEAYTNTGVTLVRKDAAMARMGRLQPHGGKAELHHVDLIRHCYEDGLKAHAYIYEGEIISGVNRWSNVLTGEELLFAQTREKLAQHGVRVDSLAQITLANDPVEFGNGCYLLGRVHLGEGARIGNYCRLEDVVLMGNTVVGDCVGLKNVTAMDTTFASNPIGVEVAAPIVGLAVQSQIENSHFDCVKVGHSVDLRNVTARATVIPAGISIRNQQLGVAAPVELTPYGPPSQGGRLYMASGVPSSALAELIPPDYKPGVFTFGEKRRLPDWEALRKHVRTHSANEFIPRAAHNPTLRQIAIDAVEDFLEMRKADGAYVIEDLTPEELWESIFEFVSLCTGNPDPYLSDKRKARQAALNRIDQFSGLNWLARLKLVIAANIIDYSSARVVARLKEDPDYFDRVLKAAIDAPLAIDCFDQFQSMVIETEPKRLMWLADNDGEVVFDLWLIQMLTTLGHQVAIVGKAGPASNDASVDDLREIIEAPRFQTLREKVAIGDVVLISSGSRTIGANLNRATPVFVNAMLDADIVISKGQGNYFTTQGLKKDTFYLLLSKGVTAERSTGVVAERNKAIDGLILAYAPAGTQLKGTLKEFCARVGR
jgi:uncharacterized protein with ATP-grasp and redox domains/bifunctional N-acetylglucosamine-1-phosphate-uridyltransferase/glucosamine-1-phosphate-acetyltransferase GlmU-like protein